MAPGGYSGNTFIEVTAKELPLMEDATVDDETLKKEINNLIWMHAPAKMPLGKADDMACRFFEMFKESQETYK